MSNCGGESGSPQPLRYTYMVCTVLFVFYFIIIRGSGVWGSLVEGVLTIRLGQSMKVCLDFWC